MCDGKGRLPCEACGGVGSVARPSAAGTVAVYQCTACMGKRFTAGRCIGCERCRAAKEAAAAKGSDQGRFQW